MQACSMQIASAVSHGRSPSHSSSGYTARSDMNRQRRGRLRPPQRPAHRKNSRRLQSALLDWKRRVRPAARARLFPICPLSQLRYQRRLLRLHRHSRDSDSSAGAPSCIRNTRKAPPERNYPRSACGRSDIPSIDGASYGAFTIALARATHKTCEARPSKSLCAAMTSSVESGVSSRRARRVHYRWSTGCGGVSRDVFDNRCVHAAERAPRSSASSSNDGGAPVAAPLGCVAPFCSWSMTDGPKCVKAAVPMRRRDPPPPPRVPRILPPSTWAFAV